MATLNDFKIVNARSIKMYEYIKPYEMEIDDIEKARLGFYHLVLENVTGVQNTDLINDMLIDCKYNEQILNEKIHSDYGIDAVHIDEDEKTINLFNFKYRGKYKADTTIKETDISISRKFIDYIEVDSLDELSNDKSKRAIENISKKIQSADVYSLRLHMIANVDKSFEDNHNYVQVLNSKDIEVIDITLDDIRGYINDDKKDITSKISINKTKILKYEQDTMSSDNSFIASLPLIEVIRIFCNSEKLRKEYPNDFDDDHKESILKCKLELSLLYDNVRGYLGNKGYNKNIYETLRDKEEHVNFFLYNNGITIVAEGMESNTNRNAQSTIITINNFQIVNGGQTIRTLFKYMNDNEGQDAYDKLCNSYILIRLLKISDKKIKNNIAEYTNSQNAISPKELKSVSNIQVDIEKYLAEHDYLYARKLGDVGYDRNLTHRLDFATLTQALCAYKGMPEIVSNKKKQLFDRYYNYIYNDENILEKSLKVATLYSVIDSFSKQPENKNLDLYELKKFYLVYILGKFNLDITNACCVLNNSLDEYKNPKINAKSRKLNYKDFRDFLDAKISETN